MSTVELVTGSRNLADGNQHTMRGGRLGEGMVSQLRGRYSEQASRGNIFIAHNVAAQAVSVALSTTYTGLCLTNPAGSTKDLHILGCNYALSVAPGAIASLHLIGAYSATAVTQGTPLAAPGIQCTRLGASGSLALAASAATIPTPNYIMALGSGFTATNLYATTPSWIDIGGAIVLPPSSFICIGALTAVTGFGCFVWSEVPNS